jgi:hypothetical protein
MSDRRESEGFLGRWSRLKIDARTTEAQPAAEPAPTVPVAQADETPPELPPVESLTIDSDFRGFFHPKVDEDLRRSALRKLFSDPHFNVMDGLDVYIDDYSVSEPIPPAMLAGLKQAQRILRWAEGRDDEESAEEQLEPDDGANVPEAPAAIAAVPMDVGEVAADSVSDPIPQAVAKTD